MHISPFIIPLNTLQVQKNAHFATRNALRSYVLYTPWDNTGSVYRQLRIINRYLFLHLNRYNNMLSIGFFPNQNVVNKISFWLGFIYTLGFVYVGVWVSLPKLTFFKIWNATFLEIKIILIFVYFQSSLWKQSPHCCVKQFSAKSP